MSNISMIPNNLQKTEFFTPFKESVKGISLPEKFNFPFYYTPHPLCELAAKQIQQHIEFEAEWNHNFGLVEGQEGLIIGKMFGVLVVENEIGQLGFLAAFSGKLDGVNHHANFVPPVFDILEEDGFFRKGEAIVNKINEEIEMLENSESFIAIKKRLEDETKLCILQLGEKRELISKAKQNRKESRMKAQTAMKAEQLSTHLIELGNQSVKEQYQLKDLKKYWKNRLSFIQDELDEKKMEIDRLKEERKVLSSSIQQEIFRNYTFLNRFGTKKDLHQIFSETSEIQPPAGAGECAAPKLLQYAFLHKLRPIAIAEFWWGQSPNSEVRKHGNFYPACRGKCEPILAHMLEGIDVDENPMLTNPALGKELKTIFEDDYLVVINKPSEFLSVPGTNIQDSVYDRMRLKYPEAKGPLVVHRLDMSTSGLMIIAKTKEVHKNLQRQFTNRNVSKQYIAILDGIIEEDEGTIDLPLRVDLDNRPQQLVCHEHGKRAFTTYKVLNRSKNRTRIQFSPVTGRTHQLRVHASHPLGLNTAILGDDLYGTKKDRLYLHAESIEFKHPITKEKMCITFPAEF